MNTATLYKRTSTGAIQTWFVEVDETQNRYRTVSGQIDGSKVESGWQYAVGKNVGKANETSNAEQMRLQVDAKVKLKLAQGGYHETIEGVDTPKFFKPMLAKSYKDYPIDWASNPNVFSQPKLDGVRCIATQDGLWTRMGKPIESCPHIMEALRMFFQDSPDAILDGELYADKFSDDFNAIISLVKKQKPTAEHFAKTAASVEYHVYDCGDDVVEFEKRFYWGGVAALSHYSTPMVKVVETCEVVDQDMLDELYADYMEAGYEGQMIRDGDSPYQNKRSKFLLKRKEFLDEEFKVLAITEGAGNRGGMAGFITYDLGGGRTFGSGIKGSHDYCRELLRDADKYVGGTGTVRFFNYTPDGVPRFPVTVALFEGERDV